MVYISVTGLPRLDLILGDEAEDASRGAFTFSNDDFFANAFDASTAGLKSGVQLDAAEADEKRREEDEALDDFRDSMADMAYLQEQITIGGVSMTVAEHGRLGKRLANDAAYRAAIMAQMKKDNPNLTDAQINNAMNKYSEFAELLNISPAKRTDEQNERLRQLQSDPAIVPVTQSAKKYAETGTIYAQQETTLEQSTATTSFESAGISKISSARASFANDATPTASQTNSPTAFAAGAGPSPAARPDLQAAFTAAVNNEPVPAKQGNPALAAADAATVVQQQYVVSVSI